MPSRGRAREASTRPGPRRANQSTSSDLGGLTSEQKRALSLGGGRKGSDQLDDPDDDLDDLRSLAATSAATVPRDQETAATQGKEAKAHAFSHCALLEIAQLAYTGRKAINSKSRDTHNTRTQLRVLRSAHSLTEAWCKHAGEDIAHLERSRAEKHGPGLGGWEKDKIASRVLEGKGLIGSITTLVRVFIRGYLGEKGRWTAKHQLLALLGKFMEEAKAEIEHLEARLTRRRGRAKERRERRARAGEGRGTGERRGGERERGPGDPASNVADAASSALPAGGRKAAETSQHGGQPREPPPPVAETSRSAPPAEPVERPNPPLAYNGRSAPAGPAPESQPGASNAHREPHVGRSPTPEGRDEQKSSRDQATTQPTEETRSQNAQMNPDPAPSTKHRVPDLASTSRQASQPSTPSHSIFEPRESPPILRSGAESKPVHVSNGDASRLRSQHGSLNKAPSIVDEPMQATETHEVPTSTKATPVQPPADGKGLPGTASQASAMGQTPRTTQSAHTPASTQARNAEPARPEAGAHNGIRPVPAENTTSKPRPRARSISGEQVDMLAAAMRYHYEDHPDSPELTPREYVEKLNCIIGEAEEAENADFWKQRATSTAPSKSRTSPSPDGDARSRARSDQKSPYVASECSEDISRASSRERDRASASKHNNHGSNTSYHISNPPSPSDRPPIPRTRPSSPSHTGIPAARDRATAQKPSAALTIPPVTPQRSAAEGAAEPNTNGAADVDNNGASTRSPQASSSSSHQHNATAADPPAEETPQKVHNLLRVGCALPLTTEGPLRIFVEGIRDELPTATGTIPVEFYWA